jgi:hypothetical protein
MPARLIAIALLWSMRFCLVWLVAHEYLSAVSEKFETISRALSAI